jgi:hypothetical protein
MILAIAALLLHVPAVPQNSLRNISTAASIAENVTAEPAGGEPVAGESSAAIDPAADQPVLVAALEPGRLTPTPVAPASPDPAAIASAPFSSSPAAAAFIASAPAAARSREQEERRKHLWLGLSIAGHSAATFDAWTTRRVISSGAGQEMDPLLRPFAGNASLYAAIQVGPVLLEYLGRRMMHSQHGWERRTWWVPQSLGAAMNLASGVHNLGVH